MALKQLFANLAKGEGFSYKDGAFLVPGKYTTRLRFGGVDATDAPGKGFSGYSPFISEPFIKVQPPEFGFQSENLSLSNVFSPDLRSVPNLARTNLNVGSDFDSRLNLITTFVNGSTEGLIRGGAITAIQRRAIDSVRIGKFLASPRGLSFILNQEQLQKINWDGQFDKPPRASYNPLRTLSQIATMPQGYGSKGITRNNEPENNYEILLNTSYYPGYYIGDPSKIKQENRFNTPDYSVKGKAYDGINVLNIAPGFNSYESQYYRDFIKFRFSDIDNDYGTSTNFLFFRATINSISDSFKPEWESYNYVGRGEKFYIYKGFDRSFTFSFTVFAMSAKEMKSIWSKLNYLASNTTPDYNAFGRIRGPLMRLTIGDYLYNQSGFIESLTFTINDNYPWDINLLSDTSKGGTDELLNKETSGLEMPMGVDVQVNYKIIHDFLPQRALPGNGNRFIYLKNQQGQDWWSELPQGAQTIPN